MRLPAAGTRAELAWLAALSLLPLLPFLDAAVSIDAPVFLAVTRQILAAPADPFGFEMIWDPTSPYTWEFNRNPPLLSYWLAPWVRLFGEWEPALHAALLPFPLLAALSFAGIARRLTGDGLVPAAVLVTTPAFLVLATSLMLDVPVLACMLLAVYALLRGRDGSAGWQLAAGLACAAAGLMKYVGLATAPLLAAGVVLLYPRRAAASLRVLAPPLALWALWGAHTARLYGTPHFFGATDILLTKALDPDEFWSHLATVPVYLGCALVFPILVWARALAGRVAGSELAVLGLLLGAAAVTWLLPEGEPARRHPIETDEAIFGAVGLASAVYVVAFGLRPRRWLRDAEERLLALWLGGILCFSLLLNWHVNAADALLAAPPLLLLLFRDPERRPSRRAAALWVALLLPLSLLLAWADAAQAGVYRSAGRRVAAEIGDGARGWFVGHWGLQHYLERLGLRAVVPPQYARSYGSSELQRGDWVVAARNVSQLDVTRTLDVWEIRPVWSWREDTWLPLRTNNADAGAGFYSHHSGYVPFAFSTVPLDEVGLGRVVRRLRPDAP